MNFSIALVTDAGKRTKKNADFSCVEIIETILGKACLAIVCDGVGSLEYGDRASKYAVSKMNQWFKTLGNLRTINEHNLINEIKETINRVNYEMISYENQEGIQSGTTITGIILLNKKYYLFHVGDTRLYCYSQAFRCLTFDHTKLSAMIRNGQIKDEEIAKDQVKHVLLQCLGVNNVLEIQTEIGEYHENDIFMLCSDGQYHMLKTGEIEDVLDEMKELTQEEMQEMAYALVQEVRYRGEKDDITSIFVKID